MRWLLMSALLLVACDDEPSQPLALAKGKFKPMQGVYVGNDPTELPMFEAWLGHKVDGHQVHTGKNDWDDWQSSISWQINLWKDTDRPIFWSIPLIPEGATLEEAGAGKYDDRYKQAATALRDAFGKRERIYVRTGWEFNADWQFPNALEGRAQPFAKAFQRFVTAFRSVSDKFIYEWTPNHGDHGMNPEDAYPGDKYVDIIGMDFYWDLKYDSKEPKEAWRSKVDGPYGLDWLEKFAAKHKKRTAYAEWGVMSNNAGPYIYEAAQWFSTHDVVYQSYWNSNDAYEGKLSDGAYPNAAGAFRQAFKIR